MNSLTTLMASALKELRHPPVYLLWPSSYQSDNAGLMQWMQELITATFSKSIHPGNHADMLLLSPASTNFKTEQIEQVFTFLKSRPIELPQKWIIIDDVAALSAIHQNKLLKVLEEPPVRACFFLLNPKGIKLLDTVLSRAQVVRVPAGTEVTAGMKERVAQLKTLPLGAMQEQMKSKPEILSVLEYLSQSHLAQAQAVDDLARIMQIYQEDLTLHNTSQYLVYKLHSWLQKYEY